MAGGQDVDSRAMAKKQHKGKSGEAKSPADQVRSAVEDATAGVREGRADQVRAAVAQAFGATAHGAGPVRERAQELADELVGAASRFREVLEELRPPTVDELSALRDRVAALERRGVELEAGAAVAAAAASPATTAKPRPKVATRASAKGAKGASASPGASTARRGPAAGRGPAGTDEPG